MALRLLLSTVVARGALNAADASSFLDPFDLNGVDLNL